MPIQDITKYVHVIMACDSRDHFTRFYRLTRLATHFTNILASLDCTIIRIQLFDK
jgi:hypothetical protein